MGNYNDERKLAKMIRLYDVEKLTLKQVAAKSNISHDWARVLLIRAGIKMRPQGSRGQRTWFDRKTLQKLYVKKRLTIEAVATELRTYPVIIASLLREHAIEIRARGGRPRSALDKLRVGKAVLVSFSGRIPYADYYAKAKVRGIKISIQQVGPGSLRVTRIK